MEYEFTKEAYYQFVEDVAKTRWNDADLKRVLTNMALTFEKAIENAAVDANKIRELTEENEAIRNTSNKLFARLEYLHKEAFVNAI